MRILYLMHVDWGWIKQRPHFLAEHLARRHDVRIVYRVNPSRSHLCANASDIPRRPFLPVPRRLGLWSERADSFLQRAWLNAVTRGFHPELIWVTFPTLHSYIPLRLQSLPLLYDCMDDAAGFCRSADVAARVVEHEERLVRAADRILCSSANLRRHLSDRYGVGEKITVVRNGCPDSLVERPAVPDSARAGSRNGEVDLAYFGTIAEWFDFPMVIHLLDAFPSLTMHLIGPEKCAVPSHPRLVRHGVVSRDRLQEFVRPFDAFIMPFVLSPLIESADPIKLYEYIAFGKETLSVFYSEISRFEPFVRFYSSFEALCGLVQGLSSGALKRRVQREMVEQFIAENTWSQRARLIDETLSRVCHG